MNKPLPPQKSPYQIFTDLKWLDWLSIAVSLWFFIYPHPYKPLFVVVLCLPFAGIILNRITHPEIASLLTFGTVAGRFHLRVARYLLAPALAIAARILFDYTSENFIDILETGTITFAALSALLLLTHKPVEKANPDRSPIYFTILLNIALYSYSATFGVNCAFDHSVPKIYRPAVINKYYTTGKGSAHYLTVKPWGSHTKEMDITVSASKYNTIQTGQSVDINYMRGLFHIPWYYLE